MAKTYGVENDSIFFVSQWEYNTGQLGDDYLALCYNASDVHLNCCYGEGFGLPIMDSQACGCVSVVPNFAAASEVGLCYKIKDGQMYSTVPGALQFMVDPDAVVEQLEEVYSHKTALKQRLDIYEATAPWRVDNVVKEHLVPILEKIEGELK
jgi:glycosyltransferase involved in cell wall biosynthesis